MNALEILKTLAVAHLTKVGHKIEKGIEMEITYDEHTREGVLTGHPDYVFRVYFEEDYSIRLSSADFE